MVPRNLNLPKPGTLKTRKVIDGLYVVRGAYAQKFGYFDTSRLYTVKEEEVDHEQPSEPLESIERAWIDKEAVMSKTAELREQTDEQLEMQLKEVQNNLFRLRLQSETERLEAPSEIVKAKREIARIKMILRQREIGREGSSKSRA
jgi:large subunit ribosomal protein L29